MKPLVSEGTNKRKALKDATNLFTYKLQQDSCTVHIHGAAIVQYLPLLVTVNIVDREMNNCL